MIHHVNLPVTREQVEACADFYELLGFTRVDPGEGLRERAVWVERDGAQLHLEYKVRGGESAVTTGATPPGGHVAFVIEEFEDACERLSAAGFAVDQRERYWGAPRAFVTDPAGFLVEIMERAPKPSDC